MPLTLTRDDVCFHNANDLRMPLGIYNVSASRVCDKLVRLCQRLETYFCTGNTLNSLSTQDDVMQEVLDYVELSLYAAAEHVDDITSIASGFFQSKGRRNKSTGYRSLAEAIKRHKWLVSAVANSIKHQQARIRMFSMEYVHGGSAGCLHGYFIEGVESGTVCPSSTIHQTQSVFSITTLVWEIIFFLLNCSRDLARFLNNTGNQLVGAASVKFPALAKSVIAAARLPLYTFGEEHPFSRVTLRIKASNGKTDSLDSGLYGSIKHGWSRTADISFGRCVSRFEGDGKTRSFRFAQPKSVSLKHWD